MIDSVRGRGRPFVHTVHDLRTPHHRDTSLYHRELDVLIARADAVLTLTPGAAAEIERRWGRKATVLPHPHVVDFKTMARLQRRPHTRSPSEFRVGLHVKGLRANMAPLRILPALVRAVRRIVLQVNGHRQVLESAGVGHDAALAAYLRRRHHPHLGRTSLIERRLQRAEVAARHEALYRSLIC